MQHDGVTEEEGWYLEQIKITKALHNTGHEKSWLFICQNWLSLHEGDCQTRRQIFCQHSSKTGLFSACISLGCEFEHTG